MVKDQIGTSNEKYLPAKHKGKMLLWVRLSNSGDNLKLIIPSYIWKNICGWSNYSCMVTSYKISEKIMEYRGSKSDFVFKSVKEQRANGNQWIKSIHLRCALMGFETNYPINILSKQLNNTKIFITLL
jgi:hypothetical protein